MKWLGAGAMFLMVAGFARPAAAQDGPKVELSGGYNWLTAKPSDEDEWTKFPAGWYFDVAGNVNNSVGIVGQITGNYKTFDDEDVDNFKVKLHTFMAGVRGSSAGRVRGFGQFLVGAAKLKGSVPGFSVSETDPAIQLGGGVNVMGSSNIGFRAGVDYLRVFTKEEGDVIGSKGTNGFRFNVGVVIGLGAS
jgi:hypothetical protein